jgi:osmotically-inducible protein OsmY
MATRIFGLLILAAMLTGCVTLAASAATETAYVGSQERSISDAGSDGRIQMLVDDKLFKYQVDLFRAVDTTVVEGRVLLTGNVPKPEDRVKATELTWEVPGVKAVMNELQVRDDTGMGNYARDSWILAKLRTQLVFAKGVVSINYNTDCVDGVVYLMGIAQDQAELDRVRDLARHTSGVKDVVSYVRLKSDLPNPIIPAKPATS